MVERHLACSVPRWRRLFRGSEDGAGHPNRGGATYSYKEDRGGHMFSSYRKQAFELMQKKCSSGYKILREGEARGYTSVSGIVEGTEDEIRNRRWGMQFRCKPG